MLLFAKFDRLSETGYYSFKTAPGVAALSGNGLFPQKSQLNAHWTKDLLQMPG
jgi:hypothetical protein